MTSEIGDGFAEAAVGFHKATVALLPQPPLERLHDRTTIGLVVRQTLRRAHLLDARLVVVVKDLLEALEDHRALLRKNVFQFAELAPAMGETVTANQRRFVRVIARERIGHHERFAAVGLALGQQRREVLPRMCPPAVIQTHRPLTHLDH